jgi:hypothetical protein
MSTPIDDGGPFHPIITTPGVTLLEHTGISLRDWFAGQAMLGMQARMANSSYADSVRSGAAASKIDVCDAIAQCAYELADSMLAARKEKP